ADSIRNRSAIRNPQSAISTTGTRRYRKLANLDVAKRNLVPVVLQQDVALQLRAPARFVLELALRLGRHQRRAPELVLDHLDAIQPVLDVGAVDDDAAGVDLAGGLDRFVGGSGNRVVKRCGLAVRPDLRVRVPHVVDDLILVRDRSAPILGDEILHTAVRAGRDLPFELEIEIIERLDRDDVAAAGAIFTAGR